MINKFFIPGLGLAVLFPFKITNSHAAGVAQDGGQHLDTFFEQVALSVGCGRGVGTFHQYFTLHALSVFEIDHLLECGGDEQVDGGGIEGFVADGCGIGKSVHAAIGFNVLCERFGVDAVFVQNRASMVHHCFERRATFL